MEDSNNSELDVSLAMQILQPSHFVHLRGYRQRNLPVDISDEELLTAWQKRELSKGVLYSELCKHMPAWSDLAAAEIDYPTPFTFIEYSIIQPQYAAHGIPAINPALTNQFEAVDGLFSVDFRFLNDRARGVPEAIMFNLFEIDASADFEQGFILNWAPRAEFRSHDEGFFSAVLHHRAKRETHFAAFNRAEVSDAASYAKGIERFEKTFPRQERRTFAKAEETAGKQPVRSYLGLFKILTRIVQKPADEKNKSMQSVRIHAFGEPSALKYEESPLPEPGPDQVRIAVKSTAVNALDLKMRSGEVAKVFPAWFPDTLGYSVAGIIDAVGAGVSERRIGEEVYGINHPIHRGGYAEYIVGPDRNYFRKPHNIDFSIAASIPSVFATAYGALFSRAPLRAGQKILIHGGSGAVGRIAVQLAKNVGAYVIATVSEHNLENVRKLGADEVIDYKKQRFEEITSELDFVLDTVGGDTRERSWLILKEGSVLATLVPPLPDLKLAKSRNITAYMVHGHSDIGEILPELTRLLEERILTPPEVVKKYPLADAAKAHEDFASGVSGRIVLEVT